MMEKYYITEIHTATMMRFTTHTGLVETPQEPRDPFKDPRFSMAMFLAPNEKLEDVISRDRQTLQRYGVTCEQVAARLKYFVDRYKQNTNMYLTAEDKQFLQMHPVPTQNFRLQTLRRVANTGKMPFDNRYIMGGAVTAGWQECPFGLPTCQTGDSDYYIYDTQTRELIEFGNLLIHLIKDHCFFEGNVEYRLDPEKAIRVLGLTGGTKAVKWMLRDQRAYHHEDVSDYLEFLPGIYGIITGDVLELINTNAQPTVVEVDTINGASLDKLVLKANSSNRFMKG